MKTYLKITTIALLLSLIFASCRSLTVIDTNVQNADLFINGNYVGKTPYTYSDKKIVGSIVFVRIEKEGYEPIVGYFVRDQKLVATNLVFSLVAYGIPLLWIMEYNPVQYFELKPIDNQTKN